MDNGTTARIEAPVPHRPRKTFHFGDIKRSDSRNSTPEEEHEVAHAIEILPTLSTQGVDDHLPRVLSARHLMDLVRGTPRPSSSFTHRSSPAQRLRHDAVGQDTDAYNPDAWPEDLEGAVESNEKVVEEESGFRQPEHVTDDVNNGKAIESIVVSLGVKKNDVPWDKTFFLALLAGFFLSQGCLFALSTAGGIPPDIRAAYPAIPKVLIGLTFPACLFFTLFFGGEVFNANTMILVVSLLNKRITLFALLRNWVLVYIGNLAACLGCGLVFGFYTDIYASEPWLSYVISIGVAKTSLSWRVLFLRAIPANALVCLSIFLGLAARDVTGKIVSMWLPIITFAVIGFEHAVANMMFIPLGIYYGGPVTWTGFWYNQSAVVLGNIVGGALLIGGSEYFMYHWHSAAEPEKHSGNWGRRSTMARTLHSDHQTPDSLTLDMRDHVCYASAQENRRPQSPVEKRQRSRSEPLIVSLTPLHAGPREDDKDLELGVSENLEEERRTRPHWDLQSFKRLLTSNLRLPRKS
ncbi:hypothetical protein M427DRAFT_52474 [Gonapodya prolifera JEL478]|uniref:Formate/nitrite transporter n=1 Tax=Gonapodya prolifera (strain JEL478) TaxID=1344416 RepID=A0A139AU33_GONPJ|nr:hypothetical protein M427DRAFT_52474 [Gonapodya prolifera JEL478]|eukprot:KXS20228.1 hypothetical protein M427DRAFT_52474 [Gonapodya prolifera JEL478]